MVPDDEVEFESPGNNAGHGEDSSKLRLFAVESFVKYL